jgi:hypothetical protein
VERPRRGLLARGRGAGLRLARATGAWEAAKATGLRPERSEYDHIVPALPLAHIHIVPRISMRVL